MSKAAKQQQKNELLALKTQSHFDGDGFFYTGIQDETLKSNVQTLFLKVVDDFIQLLDTTPNEKQLLNLLNTSINRFNREDFDTEDAENLAGCFEKIMDCVELESSEGILNTWVYGFEV